MSSCAWVGPEMATTSYREGDWLGVPLREGGYAVGLVARANPDGVLLGYFFGPRRMEVPMLGDVKNLVPAHASKITSA